VGKRDHCPWLLQDLVRPGLAAISIVYRYHENARGHAENMGPKKYAVIYTPCYLTLITDNTERPEHRFSLLFAQVRCLWRPNLHVIIPRSLLTAFRYCQPLLISRTISYVSHDQPPLEGRNEAFRLILFTFIIYTGMAVRYKLFLLFVVTLWYLTHPDVLGIQGVVRHSSQPPQCHDSHDHGRNHTQPVLDDQGRSLRRFGGRDADEQRHREDRFQCRSISRVMGPDN
jgi:hypothetical protein